MLTASNNEHGRAPGARTSAGDRGHGHDGGRRRRRSSRSWPRSACRPRASSSSTVRASRPTNRITCASLLGVVALGAQPRFAAGRSTASRSPGGPARWPAGSSEHRSRAALRAKTGHHRRRRRPGRRRRRPGRHRSRDASRSSPTATSRRRPARACRIECRRGDRPRSSTSRPAAGADARDRRTASTRAWLHRPDAPRRDSRARPTGDEWPTTRSRLCASCGTSSIAYAKQETTRSRSRASAATSRSGWAARSCSASGVIFLAMGLLRALQENGGTVHGNWSWVPYLGRGGGAPA